MRIRTIATAAAAALTMGVGTAGTANAAALATTSCNAEQVGDSQNYTAYGMTAGNISQIYNGCGDVLAEWIWNYSFVKAHPNSVVRVAIASAGYQGGAPVDPLSFSTAYTTATQGYVVDSILVPIHNASPDSWRAGAELDYSGCAAWSSQHYYGNGSETAGPYAGCNDWPNVNQIPWTRP
ncbi:hypothetical protein OG500_00190 [Kitasatospora sp. NBC_01250]|uniref:hypothetical protein n=1 Tax=unclassified Kitasatospora TaxID=2633591 RepID=UPI002E0D4AA6|nr:MULTISPECIES: hypothetical protein [unclassified Kitasatospora]WSJ64629.1 hypothetical protein OG294_00105 [Kitasatospora sp. NBC_01302]